MWNVNVYMYIVWIILLFQKICLCRRVFWKIIWSFGMVVHLPRQYTIRCIQLTAYIGWHSAFPFHFPNWAWWCLSLFWLIRLTNLSAQSAIFWLLSAEARRVIPKSHLVARSLSSSLVVLGSIFSAIRQRMIAKISINRYNIGKMFFKIISTLLLVAPTSIEYTSFCMKDGTM